MLLGSDSISQTAAVCIKIKDEIVIAADSKVGDITGNMALTYCKIRPVIGYFYTFSGLAEIRGKNYFSIPQIIDTTFKENRTFIENINASIKNIECAYPNMIRETMGGKDSTIFSNKFENGDSIILKIIFAGKDSDQLVMYYRGFRMHRYSRITFTILEKNCGIGCDGRIYYVGKDAEMFSYAQRNMPNRTAIFTEYAERLIEEAITYNPKTVGAPIDILQIPRVGNPRWIQRKPQCQD